ncbi:MAG: hypothetical protein ABMA02_19190 [Saprospiraceae bacterium]
MKQFNVRFVGGDTAFFDEIHRRFSEKHPERLRRLVDELSPSATTVIQLLERNDLDAAIAMIKIFEKQLNADDLDLLAQTQAMYAQYNQEKQGLSQALLDEMERSYLVRREPNTVGGFSYEVSHDRLVEPLQKRKAARRIQEERRLAMKRQRRLAGIVAAALIVAAVAVAFGIWAFQQRELAVKSTLEALQATDDAVRQKEIADQKTKEATAAAKDAERQKEIADQKTAVAEAALADMKVAQKKELSAKVDQHIASARRMMELNDRAMANRILDEASRLAKHFPDLLKKM